LPLIGEEVVVFSRLFAMLKIKDLGVAFGALLPFISNVSGAAFFTNSSSAAVALQVLTTTGARNDTAPYLYGWMFEDINHSGDGGIYGELLTNRAFEGSNIQFGTIADHPLIEIVNPENTCEPYGRC
jgi:alpha-N-arabinofuranosidase